MLYLGISDTPTWIGSKSNGIKGSVGKLAGLRSSHRLVLLGTNLDEHFDSLQWYDVFVNQPESASALTALGVDVGILFELCPEISDPDMDACSRPCSIDTGLCISEYIKSR